MSTDAQATGSRPVFKPSAFDWTAPRVWACPRCSTTIMTSEAGPRCDRCGYVEQGS